MERNTILIWLSSKIASNFEDMAHFANSLKHDFTQLKKIDTKDVFD